MAQIEKRTQFCAQTNNMEDGTALFKEFGKEFGAGRPADLRAPRL